MNLKTFKITQLQHLHLVFNAEMSKSHQLYPHHGLNVPLKFSLLVLICPLSLISDYHKASEHKENVVKFSARV